jgi:hypothetical protein
MSCVCDYKRGAVEKTPEAPRRVIEFPVVVDHCVSLCDSVVEKLAVEIWICTVSTATRRRLRDVDIVVGVPTPLTPADKPSHPLTHAVSHNVVQPNTVKLHSANVPVRVCHEEVSPSER